MRNHTVTLLLIFCSFSAWGQHTPGAIELFNSSFEGIPACCQAPLGWRDCGFPAETPPDIQPSGQFQVTRPPQQGKTYLGMVVRENETWERVAQQLPAAMHAGTCYSFSLYLCKSEVYLSQLRTDEGATSALKSFTKPIVLRVWGGNDYCDRAEMLAETPPIENADWRKYNFKLEPKQHYKFIILEAYYKTPVLFAYNGNVLIDHASALEPIPCEEDLPPIDPEITPPVAEEEPVVNQAPPQRPPVQTPPRQAETPVTQQPEPEEEKPTQPKIRVLTELYGDLKVGQKVTIRNLYFKENSFDIESKYFPVLDELYVFLKQNKNVRIEIGGHTNGLCEDIFCQQLSLNRAQSVTKYLVDKGIDPRRIVAKGYGKSHLIASDNTAYGRQKNQRVELKILSLQS
ncbi:MAG: OmpA family protein [Saprospiraceae bacterium]